MLNKQRTVPSEEERMGFDEKAIKGVVEDRLSILPDELIHRILFCVDMKFAVQTCLLSSRWKFLWTSMPCLNFSSGHFGSVPNFCKFVTHVLSHRNQQVEVSLVKLNYRGEVDQVFVREIANYAFSHNVQELTVVSWPKNHLEDYPSCLFNSHTLKHFTFTSRYMSACITPTTPWNFPALETLHLTHIGLCGDLFSKCVNLKNLTLKRFLVVDVEVFDIIAPRLSNLKLIDGSCSKIINVIAPQLVNLTIINCSIEYLNAPVGLSSLCYRGYPPLQLCRDGFHSLNKVNICLFIYCPNKPYEEEDVCKTINMLHELHSSRYLTLNADIVECISSFSDLLSHLPSPFSNLICLTIDSTMRKDAHNVKISTQARNFLLQNSPRAKFIMELPKTTESGPHKYLGRMERLLVD